MSLVAETATLVHGYTMADVERTAWAASRRSFTRRTMDDTERYEHAWDGIVTLLYSSSKAPTFGELFIAGSEAIAQANKDYWRHHGRNASGKRRRPSFGIYWGATVSRRGHAWPGDFTDSIIERTALPQVLGLLTAEEYQVISALAAHESWAAARGALQMSNSTFGRRVQSARAKIFEAWYAPDRPREKRDDECKAGHSRAEYGRKDNDGKWVCRLCQRNSKRRENARLR